MSADGNKWQGWIAASKRTHFTSIRLLIVLKQERRKSRDGDPSEPAPDGGELAAATAVGAASEVVPVVGSDPVPDALAAGEAGAAESLSKNEPVVSQVVAPVASNNAVSADPRVPAGCRTGAPRATGRGPRQGPGW